MDSTFFRLETESDVPYLIRQTGLAMTWDDHAVDGVDVPK
jgi:hypothetical protein